MPGPTGGLGDAAKAYPQYLSIAIADDPADKTSRCLRIELDGGAATIYSPPIEINPLFSYLLQGKLKTQQLQHDVAYYSVTFFDAKQEQKESYNSPELTDVPAWQEVQIGPLTPANPQARYAVIGLHLMPTQRADLQGAACLTTFAFRVCRACRSRSPQPHNVFFDTQNSNSPARSRGSDNRTRPCSWNCCDETGRSLATETLPMDTVARSKIRRRPRKSLIAKLRRLRSRQDTPRR